MKSGLSAPNLEHPDHPDPSRPLLDGPRACAKEELAHLIGLVDGVFRADSDQSLLTDYPLVYDQRNLPNVRILRADRRIVSVVPFIAWPIEYKGCRFKIGIISPTATHPDHRKHGYGLKCLLSAIERMVEHEIQISILWTLVSTFNFYHHGGYEGVHDQDRAFICEKSDAVLFDNHGEHVATYDPNSRQYLGDIQAMRRRESFSTCRNDEQAATLLSIPKLTTLLALRAHHPAAYLCVSQSINHPGIIEAAGDAVAMETLMNHALSQQCEKAPLTAHCPLCATALGDLLARKIPDHKQTSSTNMMVRINDIRGFIKSIEPWLTQKNRGSHRSFSVEVTDAHQTISFDFSPEGLRLGEDPRREHYPMSRLEFTSAVFGPHSARPHDPPPPLKDLFPFYFSLARLDHS